jgi:hypothetical protein
MRSAPFGRQDCEVLLACLERCYVFARRALRIHCEPNRPNKHTRDARCDILRDFQALLICKFFDFDVVGLDLGLDHCAIGIRVLRLHRSDRLRVTTRTAHQRDAKHRDQRSNTHGFLPHRTQAYRELTGVDNLLTGGRVAGADCYRRRYRSSLDIN